VTKFRFILSSLIAMSIVAMCYLIFVRGAVIRLSYLGPHAKYPNPWASGLLEVSILFALAGSMTMYFTFFEFHKGEDGLLRFNDPDSFLLKYVLKDKITKPISSCFLFWEAVRYSFFLLMAIFASLYLISVIGYIRHQGLTLESFVLLCLYFWLSEICLKEFFWKSKLISRWKSNSWLNRLSSVLLVVMVVAGIIMNPMALVYMLLAILAIVGIIFVSVWVSGRFTGQPSPKGESASSGKEHCPMIYPKEGVK